MLAALQAKLDVSDAMVFKAGSALASGVAVQGETCGALTGAIMAIGCVVGRERLEDIEQYQRAKEPAKERSVPWQPSSPTVQRMFSTHRIMPRPSRSAELRPSCFSRVRWPMTTKEFFGKKIPATTLVGVAALAHPDFLIEVEAIAVA